MSASGVGVFLIYRYLKQIEKKEKRRRASKVVFLKDTLKKTEEKK
jgi:hypothetical protein